MPDMPRDHLPETCVLQVELPRGLVLDIDRELRGRRHRAFGRTAFIREAVRHYVKHLAEQRLAGHCNPLHGPTCDSD